MICYTMYLKINIYKYIFFKKVVSEAGEHSIVKNNVSLLELYYLYIQYVYKIIALFYLRQEFLGRKLKYLYFLDSVSQVE